MTINNISFDGWMIHPEYRRNAPTNTQVAPAEEKKDDKKPEEKDELATST